MVVLFAQFKSYVYSSSSSSSLPLASKHDEDEPSSLIINDDADIPFSSLHVRDNEDASTLMVGDEICGSTDANVDAAASCSC